MSRYYEQALKYDQQIKELTSELKKNKDNLNIEFQIAHLKRCLHYALNLSKPEIQNKIAKALLENKKFHNQGTDYKRFANEFKKIFPEYYLCRNHIFIKDDINVNNEYKQVDISYLCDKYEVKNGWYTDKYKFRPDKVEYFNIPDIDVEKEVNEYEKKRAENKAIVEKMQQLINKNRKEYPATKFGEQESELRYFYY